MNWLAFDIGGANLKMADGHGMAKSQSFALWKSPGRLTDELRTLLAEADPADSLAVTMTGELADCFASKGEGVRAILKAFIEAAAGRPALVYLTDGRLVAPQTAMETPLLAAAANWRALATFAGRYAPQGSAMLIDIGSTTCDIVPLSHGKPTPRGVTDTERLLAGELIYTGVQRSPVCALIDSAPYRGGVCRVAQELFATTLDAYLVLGDLEENANDTQTADGRPAVIAAAQARLGRMICADQSEFDHCDALAMAEKIARVQIEQIAAGIQQVIDSMRTPPGAVVLSGHGEFLARQALEHLGWQPKIISLNQELGTSVARCATAHAMALLAEEKGVGEGVNSS